MPEGSRLAKANFRGSWADLGPALRVVCVALPLLGVSLMVLGVVGDAHGWWERHPFATNVVSGMTTACFGVPVALVVLQRLTDEQARRMDNQHVRRLTSQAAGALLDAATPLLTADFRPAVRACLSISEYSQWLASRLATTGSIERESEALEEVHAMVDRGVDTLARSLPVSKIDADRQWAAVVDRWRYCNEHVSPRAMESQAPWLDSGTWSTLQRYLNPQQPNPWDVIYDFYLGPASDYRRELRMLAAAGQGPASDVMSLAPTVSQGIADSWEAALCSAALESLPELRLALLSAGRSLAPEHPALVPLASEEDVAGSG